MILKDGRKAFIKQSEWSGRWLVEIDGYCVQSVGTIDDAWDSLQYVELADGEEEVKALAVYSDHFNEWHRERDCHYVDNVEDWIPNEHVIWDYDDRPQLDENCTEVELEDRGWQWIDRDELADDWTYCDHCGRYVQDIHYYDDDEMCQDCYYDEYGNCVIGEYHSKSKDIWFVDDGEPHEGLGFELEIDGNPESCGDYRGQFNRDFAGRLMRDSGLDEDECVFETDSSLESGFEIISQPHSVSYFWNQRYKFANMLMQCANAGYKSHDIGTCGLHVHVSRSLFGINEKRQKKALALVHRFYEDRWDDLVRASRRNKFDYCYKNGCNGRKEKLTKKHSVKEWERLVGNGRHCNAINESHWSTVEFRLGRGTLNPASFFAWIDLTLAIVRNSRKSERNLQFDVQWLCGIERDTAVYLLSRGAFVEEVKTLYPDIAPAEEKLFEEAMECA